MRKFDFYFANSWKRGSILFHLIGLLFIANFPSVISVLRWNSCNNASTYADGSAYSSNLDKVLSDIVKNAPQTGFNTSVYGENGNRVYGLLECRGDMSQQDCSSCSQEANTRVRQKICGNSIGAQVWLDKCFLRYDNYSFFSKLETDGAVWLNINDVVTSNLSDFRTITSNLLSNLSDQACQPANNGFAEGLIDSSFINISLQNVMTITIQGIVQCWRDISIKDCRSCLQNGRNSINECCFMKHEAEALLASCTVRFGMLFFSSVPSGANPPTVSSTSKKSSSKTLPITLGIVGGVVIIFIVCLFALWSKLKSAILQRTVTSTQKEEATLLKHEQQTLFTLGEIIEATDNFNGKNKLGEGGFGPVYRGKTRDGNEIAVKKLSAKSAQGKREFMNEVELVANVQHRNLVKLIGCCAEESERLLVYEYLPNKSLDTIVFDAKKSQLDWQRRYNIIMGIARGLLYLHEESRLRIIHRDIKASNILLDQELNPKIADFGLARLFPENVTHVQTKIAGTYGYMAPEYAMHGRLSMKVDVYSFGVLIIEIVSGRKSSDTNLPQQMETLLDWVIGDLVKNAPQTGFNTTFYGESGNRVYGLLQCAGNISQQDCAKCSQEAKDGLQQLCLNDMGGRIWMAMCFLRYENYSFFSKLDLTVGQELENANVISQSTLSNFRTTASKFLSNLSDRAYQPANKGFAEGSTPYSAGTIYGLVQCWQDISIKDCRTCLQNASNIIYQCCSAQQGAQAVLGSCTVRYDIFPFFVNTGGNTTKTSKDSSTKTLPIILGIVGGVVITSLVCLFALRSKLKSAISQRTVTPAQKEATLLKHEQQTLFTLGEIIEATDNFNGKNKLGEGGFGPVYRGKTRDGNKIAVKKLSAKSAQGKREFMNEVELVANVQHRNLVKLIGCCAEESERLLVYEYLPNKSLDTIVFDAKKKSQLDWQRRYNIIMGIARGLLYLHEDSRLRIIHRDIKASNILLDQELNPKIADFGLARLFPENVTHVQTKIAGTYGYMAPEYAMHGRLSMKVDVYSFGVLIIEIVSGRKSSDTNLPQQMETLLDWAWTLYKQGNLVNMIDSTLSETCREEEALRCIHVALLCTQTDASIRPTMPNVIGMMTNSIIELPIPITTSKSIFSTTS